MAFVALTIVWYQQNSCQFVARHNYNANNMKFKGLGINIVRCKIDWEAYTCNPQRKLFMFGA